MNDLTVFHFILFFFFFVYQALRSKLNQQKWSTSSESDCASKQLDKEEELVKQLEALNKIKTQLEIDLQSVLDEKEELVTERDAYKCKVHRLNHEFSVFLKGDNHAVIDLDSLIMENRFLQEHLQQAQEENKLAYQTISRYKVCILIFFSLLNTNILGIKELYFFAFNLLTEHA